MTKKENTIVLFISSILSLSLIVGCAKKSTAPGTNDELAELQGTWIGSAADSPEGDWTFAFSEDQLSVTGPTQEWYKATIKINGNKDPKQADFMVEDCFHQDYIGKASLGIYKVQENTLTLAASEPGATTRPASFQEIGDALLLVLIKQ